MSLESGGWKPSAANFGPSEAMLWRAHDLALRMNIKVWPDIEENVVLCNMFIECCLNKQRVSIERSSGFEIKPYRINGGRRKTRWKHYPKADVFRTVLEVLP